MNALWFALAFLTRLPTPRLDFDDLAAQSRALTWYPLVGLLLGGLLAISQLALLRLDTPTLLAAGLLLALWVWITGGLHLDGLADCADAWAGGHGDRERTLRILKDPAAGPMGVVALVLVLLLKLVALHALVSAEATMLLLLPPVLGRAACISLFLSLPYVRAGGLGERLAQAPRTACLAAIAGAAALCLPFGAPGLLALLVSVALFLLWRRDCRRRLQGFTGDAAGALIERVECGALVVLVVFA